MTSQRITIENKCQQSKTKIYINIYLNIRPYKQKSIITNKIIASVFINAPQNMMQYNTHILYIKSYI